VALDHNLGGPEVRRLAAGDGGRAFVACIVWKNRLGRRDGRYRGFRADAVIDRATKAATGFDRSSGIVSNPRFRNWIRSSGTGSQTWWLYPTLFL
jgi:hypothetical protein